MSEIDEGLDEILNCYHMGSYSTRNKAKQDILDLMCKHRGCESDTSKVDWEKYRAGIVNAPCVWCGKEQP